MGALASTEPDGDIVGFKSDTTCLGYVVFGRDGHNRVSYLSGSMDKHYYLSFEPSDIAVLKEASRAAELLDMLKTNGEILSTHGLNQSNVAVTLWEAVVARAPIQPDALSVIESRIAVEEGLQALRLAGNLSDVELRETHSHLGEAPDQTLLRGLIPVRERTRTLVMSCAPKKPVMYLDAKGALTPDVALARDFTDQMSLWKAIVLVSTQYGHCYLGACKMMLGAPMSEKKLRSEVVSATAQKLPPAAREALQRLGVK